MTEEPRSRAPPLKLVGKETSADRAASGSACDVGQGKPVLRDVDWSILMARAQDGDGVAIVDFWRR
jgi:hypothetical protein